MKPLFTIRQFLSLALIVLFAGSIVPKKVWHDAFACHQANSEEKATPGTLQVKTHKYNCTGHQADVQCPFLPGEVFVAAQRAAFYLQISSFTKADAWSKSVVTYALRGPPSVS